MTGYLNNVEKAADPQTVVDALHSIRDEGNGIAVVKTAIVTSPSLAFRAIYSNHHHDGHAVQAQRIIEHEKPSLKRKLIAEIRNRPDEALAVLEEMKNFRMEYNPFMDSKHLKHDRRAMILPVVKAALETVVDYGNQKDLHYIEKAKGVIASLYQQIETEKKLVEENRHYAQMGLQPWDSRTQRQTTGTEFFRELKISDETFSKAPSDKEYTLGQPKPSRYDVKAAQTFLADYHVTDARRPNLADTQPGIPVKRAEEVYPVKHLDQSEKEVQTTALRTLVAKVAEEVKSGADISNIDLKNYGIQFVTSSDLSVYAEYQGADNQWHKVKKEVDSSNVGASAQFISRMEFTDMLENSVNAKIQADKVAERGAATPASSTAANLPRQPGAEASKTFKA